MPRRLIDFFVVNRVGQHLLVSTQVHSDQGAGQAQAAVQYTPLRTHKVVTVTFKIEGQIWLEKWARKKSIPTCRAVGPYRPYAQIAAEKGIADIGELMHKIGRLRQGDMGSQSQVQFEVDSMWSK